MQKFPQTRTLLSRLRSDVVQMRHSSSLISQWTQAVRRKQQMLQKKHRAANEDTLRQKKKLWMNWDKNEQEDGIEIDSTNKDHNLEVVYYKPRDNFVIFNKPIGIPVDDRNPDADTLNKRVKHWLQGHNISSNEILFPIQVDKWSSGLVMVALDSVGKKTTATVLTFHADNAQETDARKREDFNPDPCILRSPFLQGSLLSNTPLLNDCVHLLRKGTLECYTARQSKDNVSLVTVDKDRSCPFCYHMPQVNLVKHKKAHPFVTREYLLRSVPNDDNKAVSKFKLQHVNWDSGLVLYEVVPVRGGVHQIRVQFADAGFPVFGDPYYNPFYIDQLLKTKMNESKRVSIHMGIQAFLMQFPHPVHASKEITVELPLGEPFQQVYNNVDHT